MYNTMSDDSQTSEIINPRKRKRKPRTILSCNDCRRRKLKCDRELPCNRCINGGVAHTCVYSWNGSSLPLDASLVIPSDEPQQPSSPHIVYRPPEEDVPQPRTLSTENGIQPKTSPTTENLKDDRVEQLEQRVASLEAHLLSVTATSETQVQLHKTRQLAFADHEVNSAPMGLFKGRNYRTFCYGPSSPMTLVMHVSLPSFLFL